MNTPRNTFVLATRQSKLALWQAHFVKQQLEALDPSISIALLPITTRADRKTNVALATLGGKDLFAKELQKAVLEKKADFAVHSLKDLSATTPAGLTLAAVCQREDPRDVFLSAKYKSLADLPPTGRVGTASPRRQCQLLSQNPALDIALLRGNVETRLSQLQNGAYDAIVLAAAGLNRLGLTAPFHNYFDPEIFVPAIGQGAIAVECRDEDDALKKWLATLNHEETARCTEAERAVNRHLGGNCFTPLGAFATCSGNTLFLRAMLGQLDGSEIITARLEGNVLEAESLGHQVALALERKGASRFLNQSN